MGAQHRPLSQARDFVDAFFTKFPTFQNPPFHPKWKEVSLSAPLAGWSRLPAAQQWLDKNDLQPMARERFDTFLQQNPAAAAKVTSDADKEALFKQFQAWEADRSARAQAAQAQAAQAPQPRAEKRERQQQ